MCVRFDSLTEKNNILLILAILLAVYPVCFRLFQYTNEHIQTQAFIHIHLYNTKITKAFSIHI